MGVGGRGNQSAVGGDHLDDDGWSMRMMFWNVCGWARSDCSAKVQNVSNMDMRAKVFGMFQPDVVGVAETKGRTNITNQSRLFVASSERIFEYSLPFAGIRNGRSYHGRI